MSAKRCRTAAIISTCSAIGLWVRAANPPYAAPVIREVEYAVKGDRIEVTFKGVFHAGAKTATASCAPYVTNLEFKPEEVEVIRKPRPADDEDAPKGAGVAETAKISLPLFVTESAGVECIFTLRDEEPSSKPAGQRTSAPRRVRVATDKISTIPDPPGLPQPAPSCSDADEKIGGDGLPLSPAAVVVVGDIVYAETAAPIWQYFGANPAEPWSDRLHALDFDLFAVSPQGERKRLTVDLNDFSSEKKPISIGVVVDASGSMRDPIGDGNSLFTRNLTKRSLAERAAIRVLSRALLAGMRRIPHQDPIETPQFLPLSNAFVMNFNEDFTIGGEENPGVSARHFVQDEEQLDSWITGNGGGGVVLRGGTRLLDAVYRAAYEMNRLAALESCKPDARVDAMRNQMEAKRTAEGREGYTFQETSDLRNLMEEVSTVKPRRALFVISDGGENGSKLKLDQVVEYLSKSGLMLYGINYGKDAAEVKASVLPELAAATGGQALVLDLSDSPTEIEDHVLRFTSRITSSLENQYELTFQETLNTCSRLEAHAYDTSRVRREWLALQSEFKRKTCQLEPARSQKPVQLPDFEGSSSVTITAPPEKPACVPDPNASLFPWEEYYAQHARDRGITELSLTHRNYAGPCTAAEIRALSDRDKMDSALPNRRKRK
jgi:hypothetical protein